MATEATPSSLAGGQAEVWNDAEAARAFDEIVKTNPKHQKLFEWMRDALALHSGRINRIVNIGGGTASFEESLRAAGNNIHVDLVDPGEHGTTRIAVTKAISGVTIIPRSFEGYTPPRGRGERLAVVSSYALHNFSPEVRSGLFYWLKANLKRGEVFILGDTVADDPIGSQLRVTREVLDKFLAAVGIKHWGNNEAIPLLYRQRIKQHTEQDDPRTAPDFNEYADLAQNLGFSVQTTHQDGYLKTMVFTTL
ncbi:MAG: hypothetical protein AAB588_06165 [Patescibacteria group bacterium]